MADTLLPLAKSRKDLVKGRSVPGRFLAAVRRSALSIKGFVSHPPSDNEWILFPFYHWVLDDEREAFTSQLRWMRNHGDFITLDDAVELLQAGGPIGGRYFCITFDDGLECCYTNAAPVLADLSVPATFFLSTAFIGLRGEEHWAILQRFYARSWTKYRRRFEFLSWDQCREMHRQGFAFGSHTAHHVRLVEHDDSVIKEELQVSKTRIEEELQTRCDHFACPWGRPVKDFDPNKHPAMARELGYRSFLTTLEGPNLPGSDPYGIRRNAVAPEFHGSLLRYHVWLTR